MVRSLPHPSVFEGIDPKRIAGNSLAIAIHALALAVLMMPSTWTPPPKPVKDVTVVIQERVKLPDVVPMPPPPQPQPIQPRPRPVVQQSVTQTPVIESPPIVDQGTEFAIPVDEGPAVDTFDPGLPVLATLAYDVYPAPRYPRIDLRAGNTGTVTLRVLVDAEGRPQEASIERSSGHRGLDRAAREQVLARWRFHPAQREGRAVAAYALVPIEFKLP